jgi:hypothetical protein
MGVSCGGAGCTPLAVRTAGRPPPSSPPRRLVERACSGRQEPAVTLGATPDCSLQLGSPCSKSEARDQRCKLALAMRACFHKYRLELVSHSRRRNPELRRGLLRRQSHRDERCKARFRMRHAEDRRQQLRIGRRPRPELTKNDEGACAEKWAPYRTGNRQGANHDGPSSVAVNDDGSGRHRAHIRNCPQLFKTLIERSARALVTNIDSPLPDAKFIIE